jgi:hypothetical protein
MLLSGKPLRSISPRKRKAHKKLAILGTASNLAHRRYINSGTPFCCGFGNDHPKPTEPEYALVIKTILDLG